MPELDSDTDVYCGIGQQQLHRAHGGGSDGAHSAVAVEGIGDAAVRRELGLRRGEVCRVQLVDILAVLQQVQRVRAQSAQP